MKAGRPTDGLAQLDEAERQIEATQERWTEADMHRARGELLISLGDSVLAEPPASNCRGAQSDRKNYTRSAPPPGQLFAGHERAGVEPATEGTKFLV